MSRRFKLVFASLLLVIAVPATALAVCDPQPNGCNSTSNLDIPTITCLSSTKTSITLHVCAGASGAPAGVTIQWALYDPAKGTCHDQYSSSLLCGVSLSGNCRLGTWDLPSGVCKDVTINATTVQDQNSGGCGASEEGTNCNVDLVCDTRYIFFVFAHNVPGRDGLDRSCFSEGVVCSTQPCGGGADCPLTWGYWKTHGPAGCDPSGHQGNQWPAGNQAVGGLSLTQDQLCAIFQDNPKACGKGGGANAVLILEHQLIAAELNLASGKLDCAYVRSAITAGNALLTGHEYDCVGTSSVLGQDMLSVKDVLASYNEDEVNCSCTASANRQAVPVGTTETRPSSWGKVKVIYR